MCEGGKSGASAVSKEGLETIDRDDQEMEDLLHRVIARIKVCADKFQKRRRGEEDFLWRGQLM
jgi:hypothetical protein